MACTITWGVCRQVRRGQSRPRLLYGESALEAFPATNYSTPMLTNGITDVAAGFIRKGNLILLTRRAPGQRQAGYWELPGGKLEKGESAEQCLEREIQEELGIIVRSNKVIAESVFEYPGSTVRLIGVDADYVSGEIKLTVHDEAEWLAAADLCTYQLAPADIPLLHAITSGHDTAA